MGVKCLGALGVKGLEVQGLGVEGVRKEDRGVGGMGRKEEPPLERTGLGWGFRVKGLGLGR